MENCRNNDYSEYLALGYDYGSTTSLLSAFVENKYEEKARCRSSVIVGPGGHLSWPGFLTQWKKQSEFVPSPKRYLNNTGSFSQMANEKGVPLVEGLVPVDEIIRRFTTECILKTSKLDEQSRIHLTVTVPESYNNFNCRLMNKAVVNAFSTYFPTTFNPQDDLDLLPEPIAAALYYTYEHLEDLARTKMPIGIITCDIGGGTTDTAYVRVEIEQSQDSQRRVTYKLSFLVLAIDGNPNLGGDDITKILMDNLVKFYKIPTSESRSRWLWDACEELKKKLSDTSIADDEDITIAVKKEGAQTSRAGTPLIVSCCRKKLEQWVEEWKNEEERTFCECISDCINSILNKGSQKFREISKNLAEKGIKKTATPVNQIRLLPVGGCMRMPLLRKCLQKTIPRANLVIMDGDSDDFDSVSRGASLYSAYRLGKLPTIKDISLENRTMYCISVLHTEIHLETVVGRNEKSGEYDVILFPNELVDDFHFRLGELRLYQSPHSVSSTNLAQKLGVLDFGGIQDFEVSSGLAKETRIVLSVLVDAIKHTVKAKVKIPNAHIVGSDCPFEFPSHGEWYPVVDD